MSFILGLALVSIAALIGLLMRSDDPDLQAVGRSVVFYLGAVPSLLFGVLLIVLYWPTG